MGGSGGEFKRAAGAERCLALDGEGRPAMTGGDEIMFETADEGLAVAWSIIEAGLLKGFEDWARKTGADEDHIVLARDRFAELLRHSWARRRETARQMLEAGARNFQ
jgi:hypothetical protein